MIPFEKIFMLQLFFPFSQPVDDVGHQMYVHGSPALTGPGPV